MSNSSESVVVRPGKRGAEPAGHSRASKAVDKATRISHACELCREKRARCNGERPICQRCVKLGVECHYGLAKNDKRRKEVEDLKLRIREYEGFFENLASTFDTDARDKFLALRHDSLPIDSPSRSDYDPSSTTYASSTTTSLHMRTPDLVNSGESSSSLSGSIALAYPSWQMAPPAPLLLGTYQPVAYSPPEQFSPQQPQNSSAQSLRLTQSLTNSVKEWQRGFIYTATVGVVPPRDVTERAIEAFQNGSAILFEFFDPGEIDVIFRTVYETPSSPKRAIALCQLCIAAAIGCQYDWDQFPDDTRKSYLTVAKLYVEDIIESHALSAMRVMALLALYFTFERRVSCLVYVDSGLAIARTQKVDMMIPTAETMKWKRTWSSLIFLSCWISATIGHSPDQINHTFHPSMLNYGSSATSTADIVQLEMCKVALLTGRILRDVYNAQNVDTNVVNGYKKELENWLFGLPQFMRIDSLMANGSNEIPMQPIFLVHLLYLTTMMLIYRRILSEFANRPTSLISSNTMEDFKHHLDACLWSSRQVSRILNVAMLNGAVVRKSWMFIHASYCAANILLYFVANKLGQNSESKSIAEDLMASEQSINVLEHCAAADESALQFLKHVKPLHIALNQMHLVSQTTAPRDVVPIANLVTEYLQAPRPRIPVGDDLAQMQRTVVSVIETLLQSPAPRTQLSSPPIGSRESSLSNYQDPETGMPMSFHLADTGRLAADSLQNYFWNDSID